MDLAKHTVRLFKGDFERLAVYYPRPGATAALRVMVRAHLDKLDKGMEEKLPQADLDVELEVQL